MATIGLRDLYRAPITIGTSGAEEYGTPVRMAKAISAELSVEVAEAILYADDGADEVVKEFVSGEITLNVNDLLPADLAALLGQKQDTDKVVYGSDSDAVRLHGGGIVVRDRKRLRGAFPAMRGLRRGGITDHRNNGYRERGNADRYRSGLRFRRVRRRYRYDRENAERTVHICKDRSGSGKNRRNST